MTYKEFNDEYAVVLEEMAQLDNITEKRISFLEARNLYDQLKVDVLSLNYYFKGIERSFNIEITEEATNVKGWEYDGIAFMEALQETIKQYKGDTSTGQKPGFISLFETLYRTKYKIARGANAFDVAGVSEDDDVLNPLTEQQKNAYAKAIKQALNLLEIIRQDGEVLSLEEEKGRIYSIFDKNRVRKSDFEWLYTRLWEMNILYIDSSAGEDEDTTVEEILDTGNELKTDLFQDEAAWDQFLRAWKYLEYGVKKKHLDIIKAITSRSVLKELKLMPAGKDGKRIPYPNEPAGDEDVYEILAKDEEALRKILHWKYVDSAFDDSPQSIYQVYLWVLRKKGFKFSDKEIGDALGIKPSDVSKKKEKYYDAFIQNLAKFVVWGNEIPETA